MPIVTQILTINAGSSSVKGALFATDDGGGLRRQASRTVDGIGADGPHDHDEAFDAVIAGLRGAGPGLAVHAVGHRIVHGGPSFAAPVIVDDSVLAALSRLVALAPLHQPHNIAGIEAARHAFPGAIQVACFDTAFHRNADTDDSYAIPRHFHDEGVRRYGFHGLSYEFIAGRLREIDAALGQARVVVAHLGNGASACILDKGRPIATTMGFSPLDGLIMGTRPGRIDPGVLLWMMQEKAMSGDAIADCLYRRSGLLALSGLSSDMRRLEEASEPAAHAAIAAFVASLAREIAALAADAGGLDGLVFTGGIGENSALVRGLAMARLAWLGVVADDAANRAGNQDIAAPASTVRVLRLVTDEEAMIARHASRLAGS